MNLVECDLFSKIWDITTKMLSISTILSAHSPLFLSPASFIQLSMPELLEGRNDRTFMKKSKGRGNKLIEEPEITCTVKGQQKK